MTNLLSSEFLDLARQHLKPGGIAFYNTTDSARAQRTACLAFAHGARFTNHMVVSDTPIDWNFDRWRHAVESTRIDGKAEFNSVNPADRATLDSLADDLRGPAHAIEDCADVLTRTAGMVPITDDNMGTEWRHSFFGIE